MDRVRLTIVLLLGFGLALHTFTATVMAAEFSLGLWLWSLASYLAAGLLSWRAIHAALGALILPALMDSATYYGVFIAPQGSTAAVGLFATPLWNLFVFVPVGAIIGGWLGRRRRGRS